MKDSSTMKIIHLSCIWFSIYLIMCLLYLSKYGYNEIIHNIILPICAYAIAIESIVVIIHFSFFISSGINGLRLKFELSKRTRIEKNLFFWIADEKIGEVNELIKILNLRQTDFDNNKLTTSQRYTFIKSHIKTVLEIEEIENWYSLLKVKSDNKNVISYLVPVIFSFSAITGFLDFMPGLYEFCLNYFKVSGTIIGSLSFLFIVLFAIAFFIIFTISLSYTSRMTNFFLVILGDIKKEEHNLKLVNYDDEVN